MAYDQKQVESVLKKAVELYLKDLDSGFEEGAYTDAVIVIDDFNQYWTEAGEQQLEAAALIPSSYQQLLNWVALQGKEERDLFLWWADMDVEAIRDMSRKEMVEWLTTDAHLYNRDHIAPLWEDSDEEQRRQYMNWMKESWS